MPNKNREKLPIIGISATLIAVESGQFMGLERVALGEGYIQAIQLSGGIPIILPILKDRAFIRQQMQFIDGLILSGGYDVSPLLYGEEPNKNLGALCLDRDHYELHLLEIARDLHKPILGICRGLQLINVAFGGTLYQDLESGFPHALQHDQKSKPEEATHTVTLTACTKLQQVMQENVILTNSFHHQAIKDLAPGIMVNAYAKDGIIEGIESKEDAFVLGVQWHPELMLSKHPKMLKLFRAFIEATHLRRTE